MSTPAPAPETTFYLDEGVRVTNTRLIANGTTYSMANITTVRRTVEEASHTLSLLMILIGAGIAIVGAETRDQNAIWTMMLGLAFIAGGVRLWKSEKPMHHLRISSSSGDTSAIHDTNASRIDRIIQAINEAIISRG